MPTPPPPATLPLPLPALTAARSRAHALGLAGVLALCALLLWFGLGSYALLNNNEGLYATVAEEMLARGQWLMPHLNGVPYPEKPPLFYYLLAASFALFDGNAWSARAISALAASVTLLLIYASVRRESGSVAPARLAALICVSSLGFIMLARTVMPDALLAMFFVAAMLGSFHAARSGSRRLLAASLAALALAVLVKGLLSLLLYGLIWALWILWRWRSDGRALLRFHADWRAWSVFAIIALPWHIAAMLHYDGFAWVYFWNEHVLRFLGRRIPLDTYTGGALYYVPRIVLLFFPWVVLLPRAIRVGTNGTAPALASFSLLAMGIIVTFFSAASAKANYYVALAIPFAAVWLALRLSEFEQPPRLELVVVAALGVAIIAAAIWAVGREVRWDTVFARSEWSGLAPGAVLLAIALWGAWRVLHHGLNRWLLIAGTPLVVLALALGLTNTLEGRLSARKLIASAEEACGTCELMLYRDLESVSAAPFYSDQAVVPVIDSDSADLWWGRQWRPDAATFIDNRDAFARARDGAPIMVLVPRHLLREFLASPLGMHADLLARRAGAGVYRLVVPRSAIYPEIPLP